MLTEAPFVGFIPIRDAARARVFYEGALGLSVIEETPFALVLDAAGTMLRLTLVEELDPHPFTIAGWTVRDVGAKVAELSAAGIEFARYEGFGQDDLGIWTAPGGAQIAWFHDPDGNLLSIQSFAS